MATTKSTYGRLKLAAINQGGLCVSFNEQSRYYAPVVSTTLETLERAGDRQRKTITISKWMTCSLVDMK